MKTHIAILALVLACAGLRAAAPPEKILPRETLLVASSPDAGKGWSFFTNSPYGRLWNDPSMKPFRDKLMGKIHTELLDPLEQQSGIKIEDLQDLARGQVTFALIASESAHSVSQLLVIDSKENSGKLKIVLADSRKKWIAAGKQIKIEQIHGIDFAAYATTSSSLSNSLKGVLPGFGPGADSGDDGGLVAESRVVFIGQSDTLFIACDSPKIIERVIALQNGGLASALDSEPLFQADFASVLRGASCYLWLNTQAVLDRLSQMAGTEDSDDPESRSFAELVEATGLSGLSSAACAWRESDEGLSSKIVLRVPESQRAGVFKVFIPGANESGPPPFVPADAAQFIRWRGEMVESWKAMEKLLSGISPEVRDAIDTIIENAGKTRDEKYDLRSELLGALGNDFISYQKSPRTGSASVPSLFLIGSPRPEFLAGALSVVLESMAAAPVKESQFLGRKIYYVGDSEAKAALSLAASGGYVAVSTDRTMIEEYLRGADEKFKSLGAVPGLAEAAQKVGGMNTGFFVYANKAEEMRSIFERLRANGLRSVKTPNAAGSNIAPGQWVDFSLLPPFDTVSKYFSMTVMAGRSTPDAYEILSFMPKTGK